VREGGCGWNPPSNIEALLAKSGDIEAQAMFRQAMVGKPGAHHDIVMRKAEQGNSRAYTLVRLKEKKPELYKRVVAGELSANAAAIEAGFRRRTFSVPDDVDEAVAKLIHQFGGDEVEAAIERLKNGDK